MTQASNILGTVNPVAEVACRAHALGARLCVDAVAYAPRRLLDRQKCGATQSSSALQGVRASLCSLANRDLLPSLPSLNHFFIGPDVLD